MLGLLAGLTLMNAIQGNKFEELYWQTEELKVQLYETVQQLEKIKEQHKSLLPLVVKEIKLEIKMEDQSLWNRLYAFQFTSWSKIFLPGGPCYPTPCSSIFWMDGLLKKEIKNSILT